MNQKLQTALKQEKDAFKNAVARSDFEQAIFHLGRAHIISQASWIEHLIVHFHMLTFAIKRVDLREVGGQLVRLFVTIPGHLIGKVPQGNVGWSSVGLTSEKELPEDLKKLL